MSHQAWVLEPGDTLYVGVVDNGEYKEVRLANNNGNFLITHPKGNLLVLNGNADK